MHENRSRDAAAATERVLVVGGSSGMGLALTERLLREGAEVVVAGRSPERLDALRDRAASPRLRTQVLDVGDERAVAALFAQGDAFDHIVCTAADIQGAYRLLPELDLAAARRAIDSKLLGPLLLAKHGAPHLRAGGSLTFTSGVAAYRPAPRGAVVAAVNAALEGLVRALAIELAPLRVNAVSPGWTDTPIWQHVAGDARTATLQAMAERLPVRRVAQPDDIADALHFAMHNGFVTGAVLHVDGGHRLV